MDEPTELTVAKLSAATNVVLTLGVDRDDCQPSKESKPVVEAACKYLTGQFGGAVIDPTK